jgi:hypothetical protein
MLLSYSVNVNYYKILSNILLSRLTPYTEKFLGIMSVDCGIRDQLLITYSAFVKYFRNNGINGTIHQPLYTS